MDERYIEIGMLTNEYLQLNKQFIEAINLNKPIEELTALKEKIRVVLDKIEQLEKARSESSEKS